MHLLFPTACNGPIFICKEILAINQKDDFLSSQVSSIVRNVELEDTTCIELKGIVRPYEFRGALQTIFYLCIPRKYLAKTRSQISFTVHISKIIYDIPAELLDADILLSAYGLILYNPKRNYENQI
jgi:hypothetical protein